MGLIKRVIASKFSREHIEALVSFTTNVSWNERGSSISSSKSKEECNAESIVTGKTENDKKHNKELKQYREYKRRVQAEKEEQDSTRTKTKKKVLSKQIILPEYMKKEIQEEKERKEGNDMSPLI